MKQLQTLQVYTPQLGFFELHYFINGFVCIFSTPVRSTKYGFNNNCQLLYSKRSIFQFIPAIKGVACFFNLYNSLSWFSLRQRINYVTTILKHFFVGTTRGYKKILRIKGVGYRFELQKRMLIIHVGSKNYYFFVLPKIFKVKFSRKFVRLRLKSIYGLFLTQYLAKIRNVKRQNVYTGKGIRYRKDYIRHKEGKTKKKF